MKEKQSYRIADVPRQPTTTNVRPIPTNPRPNLAVPPAIKPGANPLTPWGRVVIIFEVFHRTLDVGLIESGKATSNFFDRPN